MLLVKTSLPAVALRHVAARRTASARGGGAEFHGEFIAVGPLDLFTEKFRLLC